MHVVLEDKEFKILGWLKTQILGLNIANVVLLVTVVIVSTQVQNTLQSQQNANAQAVQRLSDLQNATLVAMLTFQSLQYDISRLDTVQSTITQYQEIVSSATAEGLPLLANFSIFLNNRARVPYLCGYSLPWSGAAPPVKGYQAANGYCASTSGHSLADSTLPSCTSRAFVCSVVDILTILRSQAIPGPKDTSSAYYYAWISSMQLGVNLKSQPTISTFQPGDCLAWTGGANPDQTSGSTFDTPAYNSYPVPSNHACSESHPFACCDLSP